MKLSLPLSIESARTLHCLWYTTYSSLINICIVGLNALYVRNIWVTAASCILGLPVVTLCLCFHDCETERLESSDEQRRQNAYDPVVNGAAMGYMLLEAGIILPLITIYVPQSMITITAWSMAAMGLALGGYFGWRQITEPYLDTDLIVNSWWILFERFYVSNFEYSVKQS